MDRFAEPILHVDMDAFFVEVERDHDPGLRGRPVVVGGLGRRGVVASASYEARRHGVASAMPMAEARRRCPSAVFVAPDHTRYQAASVRVFGILEEFTPHIEPLSVDEAFLDVGGLRRHHPSPDAVAEAIRHRLRTELGLPASVGISAVKFIAKMTSQDAKPDGVRKVGRGEETAYLHPLPVRRLWGVGDAVHGTLESIGIVTIGDLAATGRGLLERTVGRSAGAHLAALASGIDPRPVETASPVRSVSVEETYERDLDRSAVPDALAALCDRLALRLLHGGYRGHTVTIKVRFEDFSTVTRAFTSDVPLSATAELWHVVQALWAKVPSAGRGIRLLGVAAAALGTRHAPRQLVLDEPAAGRAGEVIDEIRERFGDDAVLPARLAPGRRGGGEGAGQPPAGRGKGTNVPRP